MDYFSTAEPAREFAASLSSGAVVKADGLAAGKGVTVCDNAEQAAASIEEMLAGRFGAASAQILVGNALAGLSFPPLPCWMGKRRSG